MSRKTVKGRETETAVKPRAARAASAGKPVSPAALVSGPSLATARVDDVQGERVHVSIGGRAVVALREPCLHPAVLRGAQRRGERVLVERDADGVWTVIGALRTQPTPGIDVVDEFTIEADKVSVRAHTEATVVSGQASVAVRAEGEIESSAPRIGSHAEGLHKITGRMLKLN